MGKMSRNKGARCEREAVHFIRDFYGYPVRRGDCFRHEPDIIGLEKVHVEIKAHEKVDMVSWYWQSWEASRKYEDGIPIVMHKVNRSPWYVTLGVEDYILMGGEDAPFDIRQRFNLMHAIRVKKRMVYDRQGVRLITIPAEEFFDTYGDWICRKEGANGTSAERDT